MKSKHVGYRMPIEMIDALAELALKKKWTLTTVVTEAVKEYLKKNGVDLSHGN